jgi:hypothetical protein
MFLENKQHRGSRQTESMDRREETKTGVGLGATDPGETDKEWGGRWRAGQEISGQMRV